MSFDQYSEKPLPPSDKRVCPNCGLARTCWRCVEKTAIREGEPATAGIEPLRKAGHQPSGDSVLWALLGALAVLLICGFGYQWPGALLLLMFVIVPAYVRAQIAHSKSVNEEAPWTPSFFVSFLASAGMVALVAFPAFAAFFVVCSEHGTEMAMANLACTILGGLAAILVVYGLVFSIFWPPFPSAQQCRTPRGPYFFLKLGKSFAFG